ncbi:hypothetical protein WDM22_26575 [Bradyrhizobium septentrionale]
MSKIVIDLELGKAPGVRSCVTNALFQQMLEIAIVLLQMMRPQKQTFRPENFAVPGHSCIHLAMIGDGIVTDSSL